MNKLKLIIKREFLSKVRNKTFLVMTILSPLMVVGLGALVGYLSQMNQDSIKIIGYVDDSKLLTKEDISKSKTIEYKNLSDVDIVIAKSQVEHGDYYGFLYVPKKDSIVDLASNIEFYSKDPPGLQVISEIEVMVENRLNHIRLEKQGIDAEVLDAAKINSNIKILSFSGEKSSKLIRGVKIAIGLSAGYLIMMFIIIYGAMVMRSVIEEKTSRIIEVIISSVKPFQLMMGKIIGTALAGLLQFSIWGVILLILSIVATTIFGADVTPMAAGSLPIQEVSILDTVAKTETQIIIEELLRMPLLPLFFAFITYFLGGYLLYSALYAAIGAAVDNETDTQQFMLPVIIPLILGVYIGFASVVNEPHGTLATVFSMIPFTSPIVMLMRIPFGVPWWQITISLLLLIGTFILMVWFAAKIYRIGILMYGKKPTYKDLYKWLKY
ncbi:MAG: ABC transporter permease [Flavobacteriaceae bacterium]|nr:MAG: ABC transporter permease [Flavobacteriaceae bacterium]